MTATAWKLVWPVCLVATAAGCGVTRGIPSHGGGKRFFEEQRVVACAIRESLSEMDLHELRGKQVQIVVNNMAGDGSATMTWPGPDAVSVHADARKTTWDNSRRTADGGGYYDFNTSNYIGGGAAMSYRLQGRYSPDPSRTSEDMIYFRAALEMKALHSGVRVGPAEAPAVLHVLVDVLGTNRSRHDKLFHVYDELEAACEITYYAVDRKTGKLLFEARRAAANSTYRENRLRGMDRLKITRTTRETDPTPMPVKQPVEDDAK